MEVDPFQIPLLPEKALKIVLKHLSIVDQLSLSLVSKSIISLLDHRATEFIVLIRNNFVIAVKFENFQFALQIDFFADESCEWTNQDGGTVIEMSTPKIIGITGTDNSRGYSTNCRNLEEYNLKYFVDHLMEVYQCKDADISIAANNFNFAPAPISEALENLKINSIDVSGESSEELIKTLLPKTENLFVNIIHPFQNSESIQNVLIQNFEKLHFPSHEISLEELLLVNSSTAAFTISFQEKELNKFFRMWLAGSNLRLKILRLTLSSPKILDKTLLLKGIDYKEAPHESKMRFKPYRDTQRHHGRNHEIQFNGYDIKKGERRATILTLNMELSTSIHFLVWN